MTSRDNTIVDTVPSRTYHHELDIPANSLPVYDWEVDETIPFDELIISWNALRPLYGEYRIDVALRVEGAWSPFLHYASWGGQGQSGGDCRSDEFHLKIYQDIIALSEGLLASGFRIRLTLAGGAGIEDFYSLQACATRIEGMQSVSRFEAANPVDLHVPLISQFSLPHARRGDMCSPSSTSSVVSYLKGINRIDPVAFAIYSRDEAFDIFGNWVLNTAQASSVLGSGWRCWVERLAGFGDIYNRLKQNIPVVVSVKGSLPGSRFPYTNGHLIVVKGYNPETERVLCMDPAFQADEDTAVEYSLSDFMDAWSRRRRIAYLFEKRKNELFS